MNCFVSPETEIWGEGQKKKSVVLEKKKKSKKQTELNVEANCALKVIIFRYFAFFLEFKTFYLLLFIQNISPILIG